MNSTTNLLDIVNEAEKFSPHAKILSACRLLEIGRYLELKAGRSVIDCACDRGEALCLWAKYFGVSGIGVDGHAPSIDHANAKAKREGVADKVQFICRDVNDYEMQEHRFDVASCFGRTECFGGFASAIAKLKSMIAPGGHIVIGEAFFTTHDVPQELKDYEGDEPTETELFNMVSAADCEVGYYARASRAEWERYIFHSHRDMLKAFLSMPAGPERESKRDRRWKDMYLRYRQKWQGMALMTIHPT